MKALIVALSALFLGIISSWGQGQVYFSTKVGSEVDAPVFFNGTQSGPGPGWSAQLYLVQNGSLTALLPVTTFRAPGSGAAAIADRYVEPVLVDVPQIAPGMPATFVMRAWQTSLGSYDAAVAAGLFIGESAPVMISSLGGGTLPASNLVGLYSFTVRNWPEPSTLALGSLGAVVLLLARRPKPRPSA